MKRLTKLMAPCLSKSRTVKNRDDANLQKREKLLDHKDSSAETILFKLPGSKQRLICYGLEEFCCILARLGVICKPKCQKIRRRILQIIFSKTKKGFILDADFRKSSPQRSEKLVRCEEDTFPNGYKRIQMLSELVREKTVFADKKFCR